MELAAGARLGPYEIASSLGAGGMGQVYRARDTRLDRTVAIKILPQSLAADAEFRQRFDREARVIAQLDHPNICALYDVGQEHGTSYLVMQLLEGETIADRLRRGPLPMHQAVEYAMQVAAALGTAHRAGIVHRDLKPGNIMLTASGAKLLDFGLAKADSAIQSPMVHASAPTAAELTVQGSIVGTFQYMAPEQIEGRAADSRTDVWGFGCVLYEMLTGTQPFQGQSAASLLANILNTEPPPLRERAASVTPTLDHLVHRCLQKEPDARWQSMVDIAHQLRWIATDGAPQPAAARRPLWRHPAAYIAVLLAAIVAAIAMRGLRSSGTEPAPALKLTLLPPADLTLTPFASSGTPHFALSPDGARVAFVASAVAQAPTLWVRRLDSKAAQQIPRSHDASAPFWFPGGESLGFFAEGALKTIRLEGERPATRAPVLHAAGGTSNGDVILVGQYAGPILRMSAAGGPVTPATVMSADSGGHRWPQFLPDGRRFIYTESRGGVMLASLDSPATTQLIGGRPTAVYDPAGWLLFAGSSSKLMAQPVNATTLVPAGPAREVLDGVRYAPGSGFPPVSVSAGGMLAYWDGITVDTEFGWFDRQGNALPFVPAPRTAGRFVVAPDGKQIAFSRGDGKTASIWLMDAAGNESRFSFIPDAALQPRWSADGRHLLFASRAPGTLSLFRRQTSGAASEELVGRIDVGSRAGATEFGDVSVSDWSRDQQTVIMNSGRPTTGWDLFAMEVQTGRATPLRESPASEIQASLSPDNRWLAYVSNETGRWEVFVEPFPPSGARWQVSSDGGSQPVWRRSGSELFFLAPDGKLMSVDVILGASFSRTPPKALFQTRIRPTYPPFPINYDVSPDGQRFLVEGVRPNTGPAISVVVNWSLRE